MNLVQSLESALNFLHSQGRTMRMQQDSTTLGAGHPFTKLY